VRQPISYISDHLLLAITLAFIGGIALAPVVALPNITPLFLGVLLCFSLGFLACLHLQNKSTTVFVLLIPVVFAIGYLHGYSHLQVPSDQNHIFNRIIAKTDVVLIGTMSTMAGFDGRTSQTTIETKSIRLKESTTLLPTKGKILLRLQGPWPEEITPGDTLAIRVDLKRPDSFRTPGVFDYAQYLARKNIWISGFVRSPLFLHKIEAQQSIIHTLHYLPEKLRTRIGKQIDEAVPAEQSGIYRAILIGDRSHVDENTLEIFKGSGTTHILAISGLHMAVIGMLLYAGIFWFLSRSEKLLLHFTLKKWAAFLSLPVLLSYGLLAGMNNPVFRAVIMSSIVIIAICTNRQKSPGTLLAFAALLILTIDPLQLFTVSFQLSFSAIIGILFLLPILKKMFYDSTDSPTLLSLPKRIFSWIIACLLVSLVANLASAPIVFYSFNRFSTVGPIANLVIEPLICLWSLTAGFLSIPLIFIKPEISSFLLQVGAIGLDAAMQVALFFSSFSFSTVWLPTPSLWLIFVYFFILIVLAVIGWQKQWPFLFAILALVVCILFMFHPPRKYQGGDNDAFQISYLDVGQGTATLLEYPSGFRVLIDGGGSSFTTTVGERVIAPFLWKKGIGKIDAIAITHPDADHYNGLDFIIKRFSPETLWIRDKNGHDSNFQQLIRLAEKHRITISIPERGTLWRKGTESLQCIANTTSLEETSVGDDSRLQGNSGLVIKACSGELCALFPGDIGRSQEKALVDQGFHLKADILLAPHHGSITSNSSQFLTAASPRYLLVSAGRSSKGYFPHKGLSKECKDRQIDLFTTSDQGTLTIISNQNSFQISGYRREDGNPLSAFTAVLLAKKPLKPR
jgi:competence protein ComEC